MKIVCCSALLGLLMALPATAQKASSGASQEQRGQQFFRIVLGQLPSLLQEQGSGEELLRLLTPEQASVLRRLENEQDPSRLQLPTRDQRHRQVMESLDRLRHPSDDEWLRRTQEGFSR